ncbi:MAG: DEAD/DEAH box helicase [Verrucomicrobiota bacterium]|nr:DEAD/DEAH box helicase [Verrucomicrobiota bacterium]
MSLFKEIGLSSAILKAIEELGFETPTEIQEKAIPFLLETNNDLIGLAQTGTGKTAAFGLPIIQHIDIETKSPQSLILCPTRELCLQILSDFKHFCKYKKGLNVVAVYGGTDIYAQIKQLNRGAHIIVATPGRIYDIIRRNKINLSNIRTLVLDEADEMLNMGFKEDLDAILEQTPREKQTLLFSATMQKGVAQIAKRYMQEPFEITAGEKNIGAENVDHICYMVHARDRYLALKRITDINPDIYGIIFCRTRKETKDIADSLIKENYNADVLNGDLSQSQRDSVMKRFREKSIHLLVATDVAARGLDVDDLTHVINYNLPNEDEMYTHRSGRTGRAGKSGTSIVIINMREKSKIKRIEKNINKKFTFCQVPTGDEICKKQLFSLIDRMETVEVNQEQIAPFMDEVNEKLSHFSKEDLIKHFVSLEFNHFLSYYNDAPNLDFDHQGKSQKTEKQNRGKGSSPESGFKRFFINVGRKDKINALGIIKMVNNQAGEHNIEIGAIDIKPCFSFFEIDENYANTLLEAFKGLKIKGRNIFLELAKAEKNTSKDSYSRGKKRFNKKGKNKKQKKRR